MFNEFTLITACINCKRCEQVPHCPLKVPRNTINTGCFNPKPKIPLRLIYPKKKDAGMDDIQDFPNLVSGIREMRSILMEFLDLPY
jgi:hypothetical protein